MTTTQGKSCVATTQGAGGLTLVPNSTALQISGVDLHGDGCGTAATSFQPNLNIVSAGQQATVTWNAPALAQAGTTCWYTGTPGLSGWLVGSRACQGASCATGSVQVSSSSPTAQNYTIGLTCTNATGHEEGTWAYQPPAGPVPPTITSFSVSPITGLVAPASVNVMWGVTGATSCLGVAEFNNSVINLSGWTGVQSVSPGAPVPLSLTSAGTYNLRLECVNGASATTSAQSGAVPVSGPPADACTGPAGFTRKLAGNIDYPNSGQNPLPTRPNADLRRFETIWGVGNATDAIPGNSNWPGVASQPRILNWGKSEFVAAKFTAPASVAGKYQQLSMSTYNSERMTMALSSTCGDFSPSAQYCVSTAGPGGSFYKIGGAGCALTPGADYYINIRYRDATPACGSSCDIQLNNLTSP